MFTAHNFTQPVPNGTPGLPIQATPHGQGPEGCNLFVFHIPNDMTNLELFQRFSMFGRVISARIMVDKEDGRSRGFGFVSYDNPTSADEAIRGMHGLQIGRKKLKVQYKTAARVKEKKKPKKKEKDPEPEPDVSEEQANVPPVDELLAATQNLTIEEPTSAQDEGQPEPK